MSIFNVIVGRPRVTFVDFAIAGGGGSGSGNGGNNTASGGGGGGVKTANNVCVSIGVPYPVVVGSGGAATIGDIAQGRLGNPGAYSQFDQYYASGGIAGRYGLGGTSGTADTTTAGGGFAGGGGGTASGGGGGAGGAGSGTTGGTTVSTTLTGSTIELGAGGAGINGSASSGGGAYPAGAGTDGQGGGGAPNVFNGGAGGKGGTGTVIIRHLSSEPIANTTGSPTITTSGDYRIYRWSTAGSYRIIF
jgi:hypothetical protein